MRTLVVVLLSVVALALADVSHLKSGYHYDKPAQYEGAHQQYTTQQFVQPANSHNVVQQQYTTGFVQNPYQQQYSVGPNVHFDTISNFQKPQTQYVSQPIQHNTHHQHIHNQIPTPYFPSGETVIQSLLQHPVRSYHDEPSSHITVIKNQHGHRPVTGQSFYSDLPVVSLYDDSYKSGKVFYDDAQVEPIVTRNYYFHNAQRDEVEDLGTQYINIGKPQVDQRVVFIQTPGYEAKQEIIPVLPKHDEKTAIYVFNKKPTFDTTVKVEENEPVEPKNPDVFFIKYRTPEEAAQAQKQIQSTYEHSSSSQSDQSQNGFFSGLSGVPLVGPLITGLGGGSSSGNKNPLQTVLGGVTSGFGLFKDKPTGESYYTTGHPQQQQQQQYQQQQYQQQHPQQPHYIVPQQDSNAHYVSTSHSSQPAYHQQQQQFISYAKENEYLPPTSH